jgi:hypothetical protein
MCIYEERVLERVYKLNYVTSAVLRVTSEPLKFIDGFS